MTPPSGGTELRAAVASARLWAGLRLLVLDVETTYAAGHGQRVVSLAAVTCRNGGVRGAWHTLIDPGVPISRATTRVHGLTDEHVAGEPSFADVVPMLRPLLTASPGEQLVAVAHNVRFDVPVLRGELERCGQPIPDLPALDTMGRLVALAGVQPTGRSLTALLTALGLTNAAPHDALADATATAHAAVALLERAAAAGWHDLDALLAETGGLTTGSITYSGSGRRPPAEAAATVALPDTHVAGHARVLGRTPAPKTLASWRRAVAECARLRCPYLADRVAAAAAPTSAVLEVMTAELDAAIAAADTAGAATLLGAARSLLVDLPPLPGAGGQRRAALAWFKRYRPMLDPLGRCGDYDRCPYCRDGEACPLDTWTEYLAPAALGGDPAKLARGFFETTGKEAGTGPYTRWLNDGLAPLADATLALVHEHWRSTGHATRADQLAALAWYAGRRHPHIAAAHASALAAGGRDADLRAALTICHGALSTRHGNTADGWPELGSLAAQIEGRLQRRTVRYTNEIDADGNRVPARRHHPSTPRRSRPNRFLRTGTDSLTTASADEA